jgi:hypothetical protein
MGGAVVTIQIVLPKERRNPGTLSLEHDGERLLSCRCLGKADNQAAAKVGNPGRDPLLKNGDTPAGEYQGRIADTSWAQTPVLSRSYGPNRAITLEAISGAALRAKRKGLAIHGGDPGSAGLLRPTNGCVRVDNDRQARIVELIQSRGGAEPFRVLVSEVSG